ENPLMVARAGRLRQLPLEPRHDPGLRRLAEPALGLHGALGRPELEHLARPAESLPDRATAVDLLAGHAARRSSKPPGTSRPSQPRSASSSGSRSAWVKSRAIRARCRASASATTSGGAA